MVGFKEGLRLKLQRYSIILGMLGTSPDTKNKGEVQQFKHKVESFKSELGEDLKESEQEKKALEERHSALLKQLRGEFPSSFLQDGIPGAFGGSSLPADVDDEWSDSDDELPSQAGPKIILS